MPTTGEISLYFHIPFCSKKCPYCHFYVVLDKTSLKEDLLEGLLLEYEREKEKLKGKKITSIYFGGGTPALMGVDALEKLLSLLDIPSDCEITLEANPESVSLELFKAYAALGINRVSLGVQSLHDPTLKMLGRGHSSEKAIEALWILEAAGFSNVSIDLMFEIPSQTIESWKETLAKLKGLPLKHLSLYNLTFEPHTIYDKRKKELEPLLPSAEKNLEMLEIAVESLSLLGLKRYEISAFAKPGFESRHNTGYWIGRPFLGLGPSAFSYFEGKRYRNIAHLGKYLAALKKGLSPVDFEETLSLDASLHERLAIALRRLDGVDKKEFPIENALYENLKTKGWLCEKEGRIQLTDKGLLFYDSVAEEIIR